MGIKTRFEKEAKGIRKWPIENWSYKVNTLNNHRLDYQPLFGKGARAPPRTHGWTHGLSIVNFDQ